MEDEYVGIELGDSSVKIFELEKNGNLDRIRSFSSKIIPAGCVKDGKILEKEKVARIIKEAFEQSGPKKIKTKKVVCSVPESKVFLRIISIPKVSEEEAAEAVKWEIESSIPLAVDQVYYDWQFLGIAGGKQNVLTVAVVKDVADQRLEVLKLAGLSVYGLEMESIAETRSLIPRNASPEQIFLIVDIGEEKTSFIISEGSVPYFTSSIPFSSAGLTDVISKATSSSMEDAEKIKATQGIEHSFENNSIFKSVQPLLENLSVEIEKTIDFYQNISQQPGEIGRIIISGGGAGLKGLLPYLTTRLEKEVVLGDPWINLNLGKNLPPISKEDSLRFATVIGLAMRRPD
ncbi:MAG: type IV pilus assembly protein PilM [Candidatus Pacebacteria bacterium]|nr:type IV pilus assembly protein PilM [Candidatus Paceibacterota bacterium]